MKEIPILMPKLGESVMEATIVKWIQKEGEKVLVSSSLVEIATDKVDSEIPAPYTGTLTKILAHPGQIVAIGSPIAILLVENDELPLLSIDVPDIIPANNHIIKKNDTIKAAINQSVQNNDFVKSMGTQAARSPILLPRDTHGRCYSPLVRYIARQENITLEELGQIPATGKDNRLTKYDLFVYLRHRSKGNMIPVSNEPVFDFETVQKYAKSTDEIILMDRVRQLIATRMVNAMQTIPHVTSFVEADITQLVNWRNQCKDSFYQKHGFPLTYTPIFLSVIAKAIRDFPMMNVSVYGNYIIKRSDINIGIAVALPDGNLIVPVLKNVDQLTLSSIAMGVQELVNKAKNNLLLPDDIQEGTYTFSNIGTFKNLMGTPIIVPPQVAILAAGAIVKKPAVIQNDAGEDMVAIRHCVYLSHTYDHRVVDGALGGKFVKKVADYLSEFDCVADI